MPAPTPTACRILIVKTGTTNPEVVQQHGDYDQWFRDALDDQPIHWSLSDAYRGEHLPDPSGFDGIIITGSPCSVRDETPWMSALAAWLRDLVEQGPPVLAVCFGHQLLGEALGGRVDLNPEGREVGTVSVELSEAGRRDPLFDGLDAPITVQATHADILITPPRASELKLLASNANTHWQAFGIGNRIRAVQFHPELPAPALSHLLAVRQQTAEVHPNHHGRQMLQNWYRHWVRPHRSNRVST